MSIFSNIKRALGFGSDSYDGEDDPLLSDTAEADVSADASAGESPAGRPNQDAGTPPEPVAFSPEMQKAMFDRVLEIFNTSLPDFIAKTADGDARRQYLWDAMDADVKAYVESLNSAAEKYCEARWKQRQTSISAELDAMKMRADEIERHSTDIKQKQLSADRQKRALSERVHDLEQQLSRLDSEREQFELENRSLVNRLKVANVQADDLEKAQAEIKSLRDEIARLTDNPDAVMAGRCTELEQAVEKANAENTALKAEVAEMTDGIESLKEQLKVSSDMQKDNRRRLADASKEVDAAKEALAAREAVVAELEAKVEGLEKTVAECDGVLAKFKELDEVLQNKENKIKSQRMTIAARDLEIESLKKTIADNLRLQAEREKSLQTEIQALRPPTVVAEMTVDFGAVTEERAPKISEDELTALEQTFETDEWFTKTPPAETPSMRPPESETDFGYRAPRRKSSTPPPGQLSLF